MKVFILFAAIGSMFLASCADRTPDDSTATAYVDSTATKWVPYMTNDGTIGTKQVYETKVTISPTWGQAFYYAYKSGYTLQLVAGIVFILLGFAALIFIPNLGIKIGFGVVLIMAGAAIIYVKPGRIKSENDKAVLQSTYEDAILKTGSSIGIWDSLYNSNRLIAAPSK
jgi:hypothetical protein